MKTPIYITGMTIDRKPCYGGIFKMADTYGLPVEDCILAAESHDAVVSWPTFVKDAMRAGWTFEKTIRRIASAFRGIGRPVPDALHKMTPAGCDGFGEVLDAKDVPRLHAIADVWARKTQGKTL